MKAVVAALSIFAAILYKIMSSAALNATSKSPVFFMSHGGPTFMYESSFGGDPGAFWATKKLGQHIKEDLKPGFLVVVSAHWQSYGPNLIEIDYPSQDLTPSPHALSNDENKLVYDFRGFPSHMYEEQFHSRGSKSVAELVASTLEEAGFETKLRARGLDHGVWVPFKVAFTDSKSVDSGKWDLDFPVVQVSLTASPGHDIHYKLGQALAPLREKDGLLVFSGQSVHNLRDFRSGAATAANVMPYVEPFNKLLSEYVLPETGNRRLDKFNELLEKHRDLYVAAHPTNEHFLPLVVASGAAEQEPGKTLYSHASGSLGWGVYEFS